MKTEIERKFLVLNDSYKNGITPQYIHQGFLNSDKDRIVRVRVMGDKAFITIKGIHTGITRTEYEYEIPVDDAKFMLFEMCEKPTIEKQRYVIPSGNHNWEVDVFLGENEGLVVAEIELESEEEDFIKPDWVGKEVTHDSRYYNASLVLNPYRHWAETD